MDREAKKQLLRRKLLAKFRFKSLCRMVMVNAYWLSAIEDTTLGSIPRRNINIIVRRSGKKGILTLKVYRRERTLKNCNRFVEMLRVYSKAPPDPTVILREGHEPLGVYFLLAGEISVSKRRYSIEEGKVIDDIQYALVHGDYFGIDGLILGDRRAVTCTAAIHTECLYVHEEDLTDELRNCLHILCENIRTSLKRFDYYFGHFNEQQTIECCTFSKIRQYDLDSVVYDEDATKQATTFFLLSGHCSILQYLKIKHDIIGNQKHYTLLDERYDGKKCSNASTTTTTTRLESVFVEIATLTSGSIFGLGEVITNRSIVAKTVVQCLEIPRFWLLQRSQNVGNIWRRTKIYYNTTIPSLELVFDDFVRSLEWSRYRNETSKQLLRLKSKL